MFQPHQRSSFPTTVSLRRSGNPEQTRFCPLPRKEKNSLATAKAGEVPRSEEWNTVEPEPVREPEKTGGDTQTRPRRRTPQATRRTPEAGRSRKKPQSPENATGRGENEENPPSTRQQERPRQRRRQGRENREARQGEGGHKWPGQGGARRRRDTQQETPRTTGGKKQKPVGLPEPWERGHRYTGHADRQENRGKSKTSDTRGGVSTALTPASVSKSRSESQGEFQTSSDGRITNEPSNHRC